MVLVPFVAVCGVTTLKVGLVVFIELVWWCILVYANEIHPHLLTQFSKVEVTFHPKEVCNVYVWAWIKVAISA